jgi:hypothetical protein
VFANDFSTVNLMVSEESTMYHQKIILTILVSPSPRVDVGDSVGSSGGALQTSFIGKTILKLPGSEVDFNSFFSSGKPRCYISC